MIALYLLLTLALGVALGIGIERRRAASDARFDGDRRLRQPSIREIEQDLTARIGFPPTRPLTMTPPRRHSRLPSGDPPMYHIESGIYIERMADGGVRIFRETGTEKADLFRVAGSVWASMVAHVSAHGETGETYWAALGFHEGKKYDAGTGAVVPS